LGDLKEQAYACGAGEGLCVVRSAGQQAARTPYKVASACLFSKSWGLFSGAVRLGLFLCASTSLVCKLMVLFVS